MPLIAMITLLPRTVTAVIKTQLRLLFTSTTVSALSMSPLEGLDLIRALQMWQTRNVRV